MVSEQYGGIGEIWFQSNMAASGQYGVKAIWQSQGNMASKQYGGLRAIWFQSNMAVSLRGISQSLYAGDVFDV